MKKILIVIMVLLFLFLLIGLKYAPKSNSEKFQDKWVTLKKSFANQGILLKEGKNNTTYNVKEVIRISKNMIVTIEKIRTAFDSYVMNNGKYYLVVDFSIANYSSKNYYSKLTNFILESDEGYTYNPIALSKTIGNIDGLIKPNGIRRGEIAFEVKSSETDYVLNFDLRNIYENIYKLDSINFKIDVKTLIKKP